MISVFDRIENIVGKGENAAFSPFPTMFSKGFLFGIVKSWDCEVIVKLLEEDYF